MLDHVITPSPLWQRPGLELGLLKEQNSNGSAKALAMNMDRIKYPKKAQASPPREGTVLFSQPSEHSTACLPSYTLVKPPAWLSEAVLVPYVCATETCYCLSRGTWPREEHTAFIVGWFLILP